MNISLELARVWSKRPEWMDHAACRGMGPALFFPQRGETQQQALQVCAECPVRVECGVAGRDERFGLWGGETGKGRKRAYRELPMSERRHGAARRPINHGSDGGYEAHRRRGETPCDDCKTAHAFKYLEYKRKWRARH